jgi:hypothetical protein
VKSILQSARLENLLNLCDILCNRDTSCSELFNANISPSEHKDPNGHKRGVVTHRKKTEVDVARLWRGNAFVVHDAMFRGFDEGCEVMLRLKVEWDDTIKDYGSGSWRS